MDTLNEIERAVQSLSPARFAQFRAWSVAFESTTWDRALENDVAADRLDSLADEALANFRAGRTSPL
jgi:hypothetical protein